MGWAAWSLAQSFLPVDIGRISFVPLWFGTRAGFPWVIGFGDEGKGRIQMYVLYILVILVILLLWR